MDLNWLNDFLALAEHGNFSRAADIRNVTQPAFSRRIRALEDWVGVPLFDRGAQGATLTPAGAFFRPVAEGFVRDLHRTRTDTRAVGERDTGSLAIAATHALSFTFFPAWIRQHVRLDALGTLNLISDNMQACEDIMIAGEVHFLLCHHHAQVATRLEQSRHESVVIGRDRLIPLSAPDAAGQPQWRLPAIKQQPTRLLAYSAPSGLGRIVAALRRDDVDSSTVETVFTSHLAATLLTMAKEGHGLAWLPQTIAEDDIARGQLVRAGAETFDIQVEIRLFRSADLRNRAADELWEQIKTSQK